MGSPQFPSPPPPPRFPTVSPQSPASHTHLQSHPARRAVCPLPAPVPYMRWALPASAPPGPAAGRPHTPRLRNVPAAGPRPSCPAVAFGEGEAAFGLCKPASACRDPRGNPPSESAGSRGTAPLCCIPSGDPFGSGASFQRASPMGSQKGEAAGTLAHSLFSPAPQRAPEARPGLTSQQTPYTHLK